MALIKCPECGNEVSTVAASCPKCGAPIASQGIQTPLATVQRTSKPLKAQGCLSVVLLCIGVIIFFVAISPGNTSGLAMVVGVILALIGAVWAVITRIRVWWHHG